MLPLLLLLIQEPGLERALADLRSGRLPEAQAALEQITARQPDSADAHYYLGVARYQAGNAAGALPPLRRAAGLNPKRAAIWKTLGLAHSAVGDLAAAEEPFRRACQIDPGNELACYFLARNLQAQNRFEPAESVLRSALQHERPANHWLLWRALGLALEARAAAGEAERAFREALSRMPLTVRPEEDPRVSLGAFLFRQGRGEEALPVLEAAAAAHPGSAPVRFELARVLLQLGRIEPAAAQLEAAVQADPKHGPSHLLLGQAYLRLGRTEEARRHLELGRQASTEP